MYLLKRSMLIPRKYVKESLPVLYTARRVFVMARDSAFGHEIKCKSSAMCRIGTPETLDEWI